jgi:hypothetical protein
MRFQSAALWVISGWGLLHKQGDAH